MSELRTYLLLLSVASGGWLQLRGCQCVFVQHDGDLGLAFRQPWRKRALTSPYKIWRLQKDINSGAPTAIERIQTSPQHLLTGSANGWEEELSESVFFTYCKLQDLKLQISEIRRKTQVHRNGIKGKTSMPIGDRWCFFFFCLKYFKMIDWLFLLSLCEL